MVDLENPVGESSSDWTMRDLDLHGAAVLQKEEHRRALFALEPDVLSSVEHCCSMKDGDEVLSEDFWVRGSESGSYISLLGLVMFWNVSPAAAPPLPQMKKHQTC